MTEIDAQHKICITMYKLCRMYFSHVHDSKSSIHNNNNLFRTKKELRKIDSVACFFVNKNKNFTF